MGRCRINVIRELTDFGQPGFAARGYLERIGVLNAERGPAPRFAPDELRVHTYPLFAPLPPASFSGYLSGEPAPDRGQTLDWPHTIE